MSVAYDVLRLPRIARPLRVVLFAVLGLILLPYVLTPLYAAVEPVSTASPSSAPTYPCRASRPACSLP